MSSPWLKKNPLMSLCLSAANRVAASVRGQATAQAKRQVKSAVTAATDQTFKLWSAPAAAPSARKNVTRKR